MSRMIDLAQDPPIIVVESMRVWTWQNIRMNKKEVLPRMGQSPTMQRIPRDREGRRQGEHVTLVSVHI